MPSAIRVPRWGSALLLSALLLSSPRALAQAKKGPTVDDASRLNRTPVAEVHSVSADPATAEAQLGELLARARRERLPVAIAGARHSMGGHTIAPNGLVLDMLPFRRLELDADKRLLRAGSGARWSEIVPFLNARGLSVAVMQSNNDFSVGGSVSVNCHGWQHNHPPIASTVESFRLLKADGSIVRCSRTENAELFGLALGGYGLFGVLLDVELRVVANDRYRPQSELLTAERYVERFRAKVDGDAEIGMVYGRLCVVPGKNFLREAILTVFRKDGPADTGPLTGTSMAKVRREVYRAQIGSKAGKELRWRLEKSLGEGVGSRPVFRNQLLNENSDVYAERSAERTDVLHEYFLPADRLEVFLVRARAIVPQHPNDLLNVTVRNVREDRDTVLRYADQEMFALVMLFNQPRTAEADRAMAALTRDLIDAALACGGRYYLPYRPHASREQFREAYPMTERFFARQRHYDPDGLFANQFSRKYGLP